MFNQVEPIPVVGVAPDSDPVTCLAINSQWVEILVGLVEKANWSGFWAGTPSEIDLALSHVIQLAGMMAGSECHIVQFVEMFEQSSGNAGASSAGWQTRVLSSKVDPDALVSLSSNKFTPVAGSYLLRASAPVVAGGMTQLRLRKTGSGTAVMIGQPTWSRPAGSTPTADFVFLSGLLAVQGTTELYLEHYCQNAYSPDGLGVDANSGEDNIFAKVELIRIA